MAYRNTRGNSGSNYFNTNQNRRYPSRRNDTSNDSYTQPAYSTQVGYQNSPQNQQGFNPNFNKQQAQAAVKQEFENQQQLKREEYQAAAQAAKTAPPPPPPEQSSSPAPSSSPPPAASPMAQDDDDTKFEKPWKRKNFQKLPKKVRKKRLNAKLRNLLTPKNAMMVLHELHPGLACITNEETTNGGQISYSVIIDIEGKPFKGQGLSKATAKQIACENALKAALFEKMAQTTIKTEEPQVMETNEIETNVKDNGEGSETKPRKPPAEDDVPWGSLASYALFKLFSEWQAQGYSLPSTPGKLPQQQPNPGTHTMMPMKKMPADAAQRHPVQLLNQLKPHCQYFETRDGSPPNMVFTFTVTFDEESFTGNGPSKKEAKKLCAKNALISLGIQYTD